VEESLAPYHIIGSPFALTVREDETSAPHCSVYGRGSLAADAGAEAHLQILARDAHANRRTKGGDVFRVLLRPLQRSEDHTDDQVASAYPRDYVADDEDVHARVVDANDGSYSVSYLTNRSGEFLLFVDLLRGGELDDGTDGAVVAEQPVAGSPFVVRSLPSYALAQNCRVSGAGTRYSYSNTSATFEITTHDRFDNKLDHGGAKFVVTVRGPDIVRAAAEDNGDGSYTVSYVPPDRAPGGIGNASLDVMLALPANTYRAQELLSSLDGFLQDDATGPSMHRGVAMGGGGLLGEYFDNPFLHGSPTSRRVDPTVAFDWAAGQPITPTPRSPDGSPLTTPPRAEAGSSARWTGWLRAPVSDQFTLHLATDTAMGSLEEQHASASLYLDDVRVLTVTPDNDVTRPWGFGFPQDGEFANPLYLAGSAAEVHMTEGVLYKVRVEYVYTGTRGGSAGLRLYWQSDRTPRQLIPAFFLYPTEEHVHDSPFELFVF